MKRIICWFFGHVPIRSIDKVKVTHVTFNPEQWWRGATIQADVKGSHMFCFRCGKALRE